MPVPLRTQLIQAQPWFAAPCFECLGYLSRECGFSWDGEIHSGPDAYVLIVFEDTRLRIEVRSWSPMHLPELTVVGLRPRRRVLDLGVLIPEQALDNDGGSYYERYKQVHPLDQNGRAEVEREFEAAVANRLARFGTFLHEHLDKLKQAA